MLAFAMVLDHCGRMMQNGRYYVTDINGNEKRSFKRHCDSSEIVRM